MKYTKRRRLKMLNEKFNELRRKEQRKRNTPVKNKSIYWGKVLKTPFETSRRKH